MDEVWNRYRDYLVWLTCLEVTKSYSNEEIHFISCNIHDFADSNDKGKLPPDLSADLAGKGISEDRFYYWNSLKSFIGNYAKQKLDIIEAKEALSKTYGAKPKGSCGAVSKARKSGLRNLKYRIEGGCVRRN